MTKYITLLLTLGLTTGLVANGQAAAKKPTIMVVPSDNWCKTNGFTQNYEVYGATRELPDYRAALQGSSDLLIVISTISKMFIDRGFPLKNLEQELKSLEERQAAEAMEMSSSGAMLNSSPVDALKDKAKADIWIQMTYSVNQNGPEKSITLIMTGLDAYTNKSIAEGSGTGDPSFSSEMPVLLEEAVLNYIDGFTGQLQGHFDDIVANGREIAVDIRTWDSWEYTLEDEIGDDELSYEIEDWFFENTVNGQFSVMDQSANIMRLEQVRIPLFIYDERRGRDRAVDARRWAKGLQDWLKDEYEITAKTSLAGLGKVIITIGEK